MLETFRTNRARCSGGGKLASARTGHARTGHQTRQGDRDNRGRWRRKALVIHPIAHHPNRTRLRSSRRHTVISIGVVNKRTGEHSPTPAVTSNRLIVASQCKHTSTVQWGSTQDISRREAAISSIVGPWIRPVEGSCHLVHARASRTSKFPDFANFCRWCQLFDVLTCLRRRWAGEAWGWRGVGLARRTANVETYGARKPSRRR